MAKKRKKFLVTSNSEAFACSLVTSPAVEETFVAFKEDAPIVEKFADDKKHMITGVVAIPNKPIYRRNPETGEEYDIVFSAEAIESMAKKYLKDYRQHEVTLQHEENADGVYLVEQWIKTSMVYDKSIEVGLSRELPVGSWIQTYYVDSMDVWNRIQNGELLGFSLECMLGLEEFESQINNINKNNMELKVDEMGFWTKMKEVLEECFSSPKTEEEMLAANSGFSSVEEYHKEVEAIKEELAEETPAEPVAEPQNNPTVEPQEPQTEPEPTPVKVEENNEPEPTPVESKVEEPKPQDNHLEELISSLKDEIAALKEMNGGLQEKIKGLEKEPSAAPINVNAKPNGNVIDASGINSSTYTAWRKQMSSIIG